MNPDLFSKLFELQQLTSRKVDLGIEVARNAARERAYELELDLRRSIRSIGGDRVQFNEKNMLELMAERHVSDELTKTEYRELCARIDALSEEIGQLV